MNLRLLICAALALSSSAIVSAQALPPTAPTTLPAAAAQNSPIIATPTTEQPHHAEVTYAAGLLNVRTNNSSLNQVLRQISELTGMKITGGVADERVFGDYGPADPPTILATLLDGTGSNMLLRQSASTGTPEELVLTPRNGGPTPPSPASSQYNDSSSEDRPQFPQHNGRSFIPGIPHPPHPPNNSIGSSVPSSNTIPGNGPVPAGNNGPVSDGPQPVPQPLNNVLGSPSNSDPTASTIPTTNSQPLDSVATPSTATEPTGIVDAPNPPAAGSTTDPNTNTNGAATPESIYQQLKALQQKNTQQPTTTTTPQ